MKKVSMKLMAMVLGCVLIVTSLSACTQGGGEKTVNKDVDSDIKVDMKLNESIPLNMPVDSKFEVENPDIVYIDVEGNAVALSEGTTNVTAKCDSTQIKFEINVADDRTDEDKAWDNFKDVSDQAGSIGFGYNILTSGDISANGATYTSAIFDEVLLAKSKKLIMTTENEVKSGSISGDTMSDYSKNLTSDMKISGSASYGKYFSLGIDTTFSDEAKSKEITKEKYYKLWTYAKTMTIAFKASPSRYMNYLDEAFEEDLLNSKVSPKKLFDTYGTHVIVSAKYGGKLDFNYYLFSKEANATSKSISDIAANLKTSFDKFNASADAKYDKSYETAAQTNKVEVKINTTVVGGDLNDMKSAESIAVNYSKWLQSIKESPAFIGPVDSNSLVPLWNILPDTDEYASRRNELIEYFRTQAEKNYDTLMSTYGKIRTENSQLVYGSYPQDVADSKVAAELEAGKGEAIGSFYKTNDILRYNEKDYLAYTPQNTVNGYKANQTYYFEFSDLKWDYYGKDAKGQKLYTCDSIVDASFARFGYQNEKTERITFDQKLSAISDDTAKNAVREVSKELEGGSFYSVIFLNSVPAESQTFAEKLVEDYETERYYPSTQNDLLKVLVKLGLYNEDGTQKGDEYVPIKDSVDYSIIRTNRDTDMTWQNTELRGYLNGIFAKNAFADANLSNLGTVRTYTHSIACSDKVAVAPSKGEYEGKACPITDFAYARGINTSVSFWASYSNFTDPAYCGACNIYGKSHNTAMLFAYVNNEGKWFETESGNLNQGVRPTIAIKN